MSVFEIGAAGCRNLKYVLDENETIKLGANDLFKESSFRNMDEKVKEKIDFYECDTLDLFKTYQIHPDLLISSDHLMHVEKKSVEIILDKIRKEWKPKYILLREIKLQYENLEHPRLFHPYFILSNQYKVIHKQTSKQTKEYFIKLYKRKDL